MEDVQIILAFLWTALMLSNLWGDVLRLYAGDVTPGEIEGQKLTPVMLMTMAVLMVIPILMIVLTLILPYNVSGWANIIISTVFLSLISVHCVDTLLTKNSY